MAIRKLRKNWLTMQKIIFRDSFYVIKWQGVQVLTSQIERSDPHFEVNFDKPQILIKKFLLDFRIESVFLLPRGLSVKNS